MRLSNGKFDEQYAKMILTSYLKQGYCSIEAMVTLIRNDFRELTLDKAVSVVNRWIDSEKIQHEHLDIVYNKRLQKRVVVKKSFADELRRRLEQ